MDTLSSSRLSRLIDMARPCPVLRMGVVHPCDILALSGALAAAETGLIVPVLVGPEKRMRAMAAANGLSLQDAEIVDAPHSHAAAEQAVAMARTGAVGALMKGSLSTEELMQAVVDHDKGLRTDRRMSHIFVMDAPPYKWPLLITDAGLNIAPDLVVKRDICQNAIWLAQDLGVSEPKVALLAATEKVNPHMPATLDAAALCKMAMRGQITGGVLEGPLALDNAVSKEAAKIKGIASPVAGDADILVVPNIEAGNMLAKELEYLASAGAAGLVVGARVPIVLTSRADGVGSRRASAALALLAAEGEKTRLAAKRAKLGG